MFVPPPIRRGRLRHIGPNLRPSTAARNDRKHRLASLPPGGRCREATDEECGRKSHSSYKYQAFSWAVTPVEAFGCSKTLGYLPHSSSGPPGHLPPGGRDRRTASFCWGAVVCGRFGPMCLNRPLRRGWGAVGAAVFFGPLAGIPGNFRLCFKKLYKSFSKKGLRFPESMLE